MIASDGPGAQSRRVRLAQFLVNWRLLLSLVSVAFCILLATVIPQSQFDTSLDALLTKSDPFLPEVEALEAQFPTTLEVRFALTAPPMRPYSIAASSMHLATSKSATPKSPTPRA